MLNKMLLSGARARMTTQLLPFTQANIRLSNRVQCYPTSINTMFAQNKRFFSDAAVATQNEEPEPESIEDTNARIGVDTVFSK